MITDFDQDILLRPVGDYTARMTEQDPSWRESVDRRLLMQYFANMWLAESTPIMPVELVQRQLRPLTVDEMEWAFGEYRDVMRYVTKGTEKTVSSLSSRMINRRIFVVEGAMSQFYLVVLAGDIVITPENMRISDFRDDEASLKEIEISVGLFNRERVLWTIPRNAGPKSSTLRSDTGGTAGFTLSVNRYEVQFRMPSRNTNRDNQTAWGEIKGMIQTDQTVLKTKIQGGAIVARIDNWNRKEEKRLRQNEERRQAEEQQQLGPMRELSAKQAKARMAASMRQLAKDQIEFKRRLVGNIKVEAGEGLIGGGGLVFESADFSAVKFEPFMQQMGGVYEVQKNPDGTAAFIRKDQRYQLVNNQDGTFAMKRTPEGNLEYIPIDEAQERMMKIAYEESYEVGKESRLDEELDKIRKLGPVPQKGWIQAKWLDSALKREKLINQVDGKEIPKMLEDGTLDKILLSVERLYKLAQLTNSDAVGFLDGLHEGITDFYNSLLPAKESNAPLRAEAAGWIMRAEAMLKRLADAVVFTSAGEETQLSIHPIDFFSGWATGDGHAKAIADEWVDDLFLPLLEDTASMPGLDRTRLIPYRESLEALEGKLDAYPPVYASKRFAMIMMIDRILLAHQVELEFANSPVVQPSKRRAQDCPLPDVDDSGLPTLPPRRRLR